jgi:hypothetical protein
MTVTFILLAAYVVVIGTPVVRFIRWRREGAWGRAEKLRVIWPTIMAERRELERRGAEVARPWSEKADLN